MSGLVVTIKPQLFAIIARALNPVNGVLKGGSALSAWVMANGFATMMVLAKASGFFWRYRIFADDPFDSTAVAWSRVEFLLIISARAKERT